MSGTLKIWEYADNLQALWDTREGATEPAAIAEIDKAMVVQLANIAQKTDGIYEFLSRSESEEKRLAEEIKSLQARKKATENRADWAKGQVMAFLLASDQKELKGDIHRLYRQINSAAALDIVNEGEIPSRFFDIIVERKIRKDEVTKALEAGEEIPGARLNRGEHIRRK